MAITVSKQFKENYQIVEQSWRERGDKEEEIAALKDAIRIDLSDGDGFLRDPEHLITDPDVRRKMWDEYFQGEADAIRGLVRYADGINTRIVNANITRKRERKSA